MMFPAENVQERLVPSIHFSLNATCSDVTLPPVVGGGIAYVQPPQERQIFIDRILKCFF